MNSLPKLQTTPFLFLLYAEWVMLASCGFLAVVETLEQGYFPIQHALILASLGVMGLMLPHGNPMAKVAYTIIEIGLIFYGTVLGYLHILPTLYLIVVMRSCFIFELPARWAIASLSFVLYSAHQIQYAQVMRQLLSADGFDRFWMHQLSEVLMFALGLLLVLRLANTLLAERHTQQRLSSAHEQLQQYALQIEDLAAVRERNRIARDIHDSLGHALTTLNIQLQSAVKLWKRDPAKAQPFLEQAQQLGTLAMKEVRQSVNTLRADAEDEMALEKEIERLVKDFYQGTGIAVITNIDLEIVLPSQVVKTLYRIVQESLTNICKYAHATEVKIQAIASSHRACLIVEDNGKGFQASTSTSGYGLQGMQERVAALKGSFHLDTQPGSGCRIAVEIPVL